MRINKYLAACGMASRRDCDSLIAEGRVQVNGKKASVGMDVNEEDEVYVDGRKAVLQKNEYYILNKPKGYICSVSDDKGRKTVLDLMPKNVGRIYPVGRLDYDSEGLLILTTDGALAQRLTRPTKCPKLILLRLRARVQKRRLILSAAELKLRVVT